MTEIDFIIYAVTYLSICLGLAIGIVAALAGINHYREVKHGLYPDHSHYWLWRKI